ncbi:MAG: DUF2997 domain-containing protein [Cyanobacteria bacterium SIG28]|nr:DUF2997 domain-containing protein [Cyanobacteria bacterium SIG28]
MSKKMIIKLSPNGEIQMTTQGVKGKKCLDYIEVFKKLVKVNVIDTKLTDEYYETETELITENQEEIRIDN